MSTVEDKAFARKRAIKEFLIGAAVAIAGGAMTYFSYENARPGESYTIFTGLIVLGVIYAVKGLYGIILPLGIKGLRNNKTAENFAEIEDAREAKTSEKDNEAGA